MKCRDVERWLVLGSNGAADDGTREAVLVHLEGCSGCASIARELDGLRGALAGRALSEPPAALVEKTRRLCLERIEARAASETKTGTAPRPAGYANGALRRIPPAVWAATIGLLVATALILVPFFGDVLRSEPLSYVSRLGLGFAVQNVLMLLFSPLLLRRAGGSEARA